MFSNQQSFGFRLAMISTGIIGLMAISSGVASIVTYKPYGVHDDEREKYDEILQDLQRQNRLRERGTDGSEAKIAFSTLEHDFGFVAPQTVEASHDFVISNEGKSDLFLEPVSSSCKCTVAKLDDPIVEPGKSTTIKVVWNAGSELTDQFEQSATIKTNDPQREEIELTVRGKVATRWAFASTIRPAGKAIIGQSISGSTILYSQYCDDLVVLETTSSSPALTIETEPVRPADLLVHRAKSGVRVVASYQPTDEREKVIESIRCRLLDPNTGEEQWVETEFKGTYSQPVGFYGPSVDMFNGLDLGLLTIGSDKEASVLVKFLEKTPPVDPAVLRLEPPSLEAELTPLDRVPNGYRLTIRLRDDAVPAMFRFNRQGYVEVGDRKDPSRKNWLPLSGQIITPAKND